MKRRSLLIALTTSLIAAGTVLAAPAVAAAPTITSFTPASGKLYSTVTLTGSGFTSPATVKFNGVASTSTTVQSATTIATTVPATAASGPISVTTAGGTATSSASFQVLPGVHLSVTVGPPTTRTIVYVSGFAASEAVDLSFNTTTLKTLVTGSTGAAQVTVPVPTSAPPGAQTFTAVGRRSGSAAQTTFTVRTDVTHVGFDNGHTGANPYENQLSPTNVAKASQLWSTSLLGPTGPIATPAVVAGVVYEPAGDGSVRAFDATTGAQKWSFSTGGTSMYSSPAVSGGVVYVGSNDHNFYAINATTGVKKWSFSTGASVYGSPTVIGSTVYFGSYDYNVYAVNIATGTQVWKHPMASDVLTAPTYADGTIFVGDFNGNAVALNASTGAVVWSDSGLGALVAPLIVADGLVFADGETNLEALDEDDGEVEWTKTSDSDAAALDSGMLIVPNNYGGVTAYDAATGSVIWTRDLSASSGALRAAVTVANGIVFVGGYSYTYALRESDGALLRTFTAGGIYGGVAIADGTITVPNYRKGTLVRYGLPASAIPGAAKPAAVPAASLAASKAAKPQTHAIDG